MTVDHRPEDSAVQDSAVENSAVGIDVPEQRAPEQSVPEPGVPAPRAPEPSAPTRGADPTSGLPWGALLLVVLLVVAALTVGWWMPSTTGALATVGHGLQQRATDSRALESAVAALPDTGRVVPGLVNIDTVLDNGEGAGTGMVLSPTGLVLTNNHVISGARTIAAVDVGNARRYAADVVGYDRTHDVAVLQLRGASRLVTAPLGSSAGLRPGDPVTAVGNAGGRGGPPAQAPGRVVALDQSVTAADETGGAESLAGMILAQADVRAGESGGAMVGPAGTVVGMTTAAASSRRIQQAGGAGFAIPIDQARGIADQIVGGGGGPAIHRGPTAILGIQVSQDGGDPGDGTPPSVTVQGVDPGSSPEAAGLAVGDTVTTLDGRPTTSQSALADALGSHRPGDRVQLGWTDALGAPHRGSVRLVEGPPA